MMKLMFSSKKDVDEKAQATNALTLAVSALTERVKSLEKKVDELENTIAELQKAAAEKAEAIKPGSTTTDSEVVAEAPRSIGRFYLAAPTPEGLFVDVSPTEQTGKSIYVLTTDDGNTGFFSLIDSDEAMATAMISLSQFVKTACKVVGNTNRPSRHVVNVEEGTVTRAGDVWKIMRKAVVRFE